MGRFVTVSASTVWHTSIRSWTMDSLYLRIFVRLQVPINFDGEPIRFVIVLKGGILIYFLQMRIDVTAVKWSRSSRFFFFFLFLLSLSFVSGSGFVAVQVQSGKEIFHGISGSGSHHRRVRTSITSLLVASVTWGRISSIGRCLVTSSVRLRLS